MLLPSTSVTVSPASLSSAKPGWLRGTHTYVFLCVCVRLRWTRRECGGDAPKAQNRAKRKQPPPAKERTTTKKAAKIGSRQQNIRRDESRVYLRSQRAIRGQRCSSRLSHARRLLHPVRRRTKRRQSPEGYARPTPEKNEKNEKTKKKDAQKTGTKLSLIHI